MSSKRIVHQYVDVQTTVGATTATFAVYALPSGSAAIVEADIIGRDTTTGDAAAITLTGGVKNVAGTHSLAGTPAVAATIGDASVVASVGSLTASTGVEVKVTGVALLTIEWTAHVMVVVD